MQLCTTRDSLNMVLINVITGIHHMRFGYVHSVRDVVVNADVTVDARGVAYTG